MKRFKVLTILAYIACFCLYLLATVFFLLKSYVVAVILLCFGVTFLCLGAVSLKCMRIAGQSIAHEGGASGKKYTLVTGAMGGMGRKTVEALVASGYTVFALDKRIGAWEGLEEFVIPLAVDITDEESVQQAFRLVAAHTGGLESILHFAGTYMLDSLVEMDSSAFDRAFAVNLKGTFLVNKVFLPLLGKGSRILITTSELAPLDPLPFTGIYAVTKAALDKYAYSLAMELQLLGIRVSVLRAGAVDTGMLGASTEALDRFISQTELYTCNANRFQAIVNKVEARCVKPEKIALKALKILGKKHPKFAYAINRNPLLLLLNLLPKRLQLFAIRKVLK